MTQIPQSWELSPLENLVSSISNGLTYSNSPASGGLPISRIQSISKSEIDFSAVGYAGLHLEGNEKYLLSNGDILFSHINSKEHVGKVAQYRKGMPQLIHGMNLLRIVANELVLPEYLLWAFRSDFVRDQIRSITRNAVNQASVNIRNLSKISIPLPSPDTQKRIVETLEDHLSRLDKAAELTSQSRNAVGHLVQSTMHKIMTSDPNARELQFKDALTLQRGFDLPVQSRREGSVPIISSNGHLGMHNEAKVPGPGVATGRSGTIGKVFYVEEDFWALNTALFVKDFKGNHPRFIYYLLQTIDLPHYAGGSTVPSLDRKVLHEIPVMMPSLNVQIAISDELDRLISKIDVFPDFVIQAEQNISLARKALLHAAFTGQLTHEDSND